jgi:DNA-binding winged helix-turn-helix (wHTH) protein
VSDGFLTTAELAARPDFALGSALVSPSRRTIVNGEASTEVEPRVMQVLVVLADAKGQVVTRETLFRRCWGSADVGNDSLNRAIAGLRKLFNEVGAGGFAVETVPRTGYQLTVADDANRADPVAKGGGPSRRLVIGAGAAAAALAAAAGATWWATRDRHDPRLDVLIEKGLAALRYGVRASDAEAVANFRQATALDPASASAWGLLAYALMVASQSGARAEAGATVQRAQGAARMALRLDPNNADAMIALNLIERSFESRAAVEDGLRRILAASPGNPRAMLWLARLLQGVGRARESWQLNERLIAAEPVCPTYLLSRALKLWVFGQSEQAQLASQSALDLWPAHPLVRMARLLICAFTDRTHEALALVEEEASKPMLLSPAGLAMWRASLAALGDRTSENVAKAKALCLEGARSSPPLAAYALVVMSALGDLDSAFEIANGFLLGRGPVVLARGRQSDELWADAPQWRNTLGLFTPPAKAMRLDARFGPLCDGLGLTEYWRARSGPDAFLVHA